ncbi:MAG: DUF2092 domain-containing protein [Verrucomicrobia bacterium]|nr:DUF2092 domain-containing protein [Verrucomicrobiota bacterium]
MKILTQSKFLPLLTLVGLASLPSFALAEDKAKAEEAPAVDPMAVKILKRASDHLSAAKQFSVSAEIWQDLEDENGTMLQFSKLADVKVRRPDGIRIDIKTDKPKRSFYYDGKSVSVVDHQKGYYGNVAAPATIEETLDKLDEKFGITMPLEDLLIARPFGGAATKAKAGQYLGKEPVLGVLCHHVAFQGESVDWQAWVNEGPVPTIRKVVITFKQEQGRPQFIALFSDWDTTSNLPAYVFTFDPSAGVLKIEVLPNEEEGEQKAAPKK